MTKNMEDLASVSLAQSFVPFQFNGYQNSAAFQELLFMPNDLHYLSSLSTGFANIHVKATII